MGNAQTSKTIFHIQHDPAYNGIKECRFTHMNLVHSNKMLVPNQCDICHRTMCRCAYISQQTLKGTRFECSQCVNKGQRKTLTKILKNELNHHPMEVIQIIIDFAAGLIANCCNIQCDEEISFQNIFFFFKQMDIDRNNIYHYEVPEISALKTVYIGCIDKKMRIFCKSCTKETKNCQKIGCKYKDIYFDNDKNVCSHHPLCIVCGEISIFELSKCVDCHQSVCNNSECSIYQNGRKCKFCHETHEKKAFNNVLQNVLCHTIMDIDINIIHIITNFALGFIISCCNDECNQEIIFRNRFDFIKKKRDNYIYYYTTNEYNKLKSVETPYTDKNIRIFCKLCIKMKVQCKYPGCKDEAVHFEWKAGICSNHSPCVCCGEISIPISRKMLKCDDCDRIICGGHKCSIFDTGSLCTRGISNDECRKYDMKRKCRFCYETDEKKRLLDAVEDVLHSILDTNSINIIIDFGFGCIAKCCNDECDQEIAFRNKIDFINKIDDMNNCIYYYKTNKFNKLKRVQTPYIDGEIRIFCQLCSKKKAECKYENCGNEDVYFELNGICSNHYCPQCIVCGQQFKYSTYLAECTNCNQYICPELKCGLEIKNGITICKFCMEKEKKTLMIDVLIQVIGHVLYDMIIQNICDFAFELVMDCSNPDCDQHIDFSSYPAHSGVYWYNINEVNPENLKFRVQQTDIVHNIKGEYLRIFCSNCTANNISECEAEDCDHKDVNHICFSHSYYCSQCKQRQKDEVRKYEYYTEPCCIRCSWQRQQLIKLNKIQLKNICKLYNLSTEGNKINLIDEILDCLNDKVVYNDIEIEIERACLRKLNKKQLKNICKSKGLSTNGNKQSLIEIILFHNSIMDNIKQEF